MSSFTFELTLQVGDFQSEWERCNMLANYLGEYVAYQFAQRERAENLVSTIVNEFLESVIALAPGVSPLHLACTQTEQALQLKTVHQMRLDAVTPYMDFVADLRPGDNQDSYLALLAEATRPELYFNQLGLTMLSHDFGVRLSSHFDEGTKLLHIQLTAPMEELTI